MVKRLALARRTALLTALAGALLAAPAAGAGDVRLEHAIGGVCADCDFSGRDLSGDPVIGVLPRANFSNAILTGARIGGNFASATFARADLTDASVQSANFVNADFSGAKLDGARVSGANFFRVDFTGATLRDVRASSTNFSSASFLAAKLDGAVLEAVDVSRADFARAELPGAVLARADLAGASFEDANLRGADLSGADATGAELPGADLSDAVLDKTILSGADLSGAHGLTAAALATACGDSETRLPPGLAVAPCPDVPKRTPSAALSAAPPLGALHGSDAALPARPADAMDALLSELGLAGRPADRLAEARRAISTAYTEAHADLDLEVREAILAASEALAEVDVAGIVGSDEDIRRAIGTLQGAEMLVNNDAVLDALERARGSLETLSLEMADIRAELRGEPREALATSLERERAKRNRLLDRELASRERRLDREIEAQLRTLEADCMRTLHELEAGRAARDEQSRAAEDCRVREQALAAERASRHRALTEEIEAERGRIEAEIAALAREAGLP